MAARFGAVDAAFRRLLGDEVLESDEMRRAADLARTAAEEAGRRPEGRPLAAAHADVGWPTAPHLQLWHAQSILREFRGDGHVALLVVHGLSGIEALVTHAAAGDVPAHVLRTDPRAGPQDAMGGGGRRAARAGLAPEGRRAPLHRLGRVPSAVRSRRAPTLLAAAPYAVLGDDGCAELRALARPWSTVFAGQLPRLEVSVTGRHRRLGIIARAPRALGRLAQLVRAAGLQPAGRGFESLSAHADLSAHSWLVRCVGRAHRCARAPHASPMAAMAASSVG